MDTEDARAREEVAAAMEGELGVISVDVQQVIEREIRFTRLFIEELHCQSDGEQIDGSTTIRAIEQINAYSDRVVEQVLEAYEQERSGWLQNRSAVQATRVRSICDGRVAEEHAFDLRRVHVLATGIDHVLDPVGDE